MQEYSHSNWSRARGCKGGGSKGWERRGGGCGGGRCWGRGEGVGVGGVLGGRGEWRGRYGGVGGRGGREDVLIVKELVHTVARNK